MAKVQTTQNDNLSDVAYDDENMKADDPSSLRNQVSATDGSVTIISGFGCSLVLNWSFTSSAVNVQVQLQTPVGNISLINTTVNPNDPSVTFGGSIGPFKAQGTISFNIGALTLTASGEVCAPLLGCKSGSVTINV